MAKGSPVTAGVLQYNEHEITPEDFLHFFECDGFSDDWKRLELNVEEDLLSLQVAIMADPTGSPVIAGTGGLRKLKFVPHGWSIGKRGALRVCYVYFQTHWTILLVMAYSRVEKDNLSPKEKAGIKRYIADSEKWLAERNY